MSTETKSAARALPTTHVRQPPSDSGAAVDSYVAIPAATIMIGTITPCDLYTPIGDEQILYWERGIPIDREKRYTIGEQRLTHLYIRGPDQSRYTAYVQQHIERLLGGADAGTADGVERFFVTSRILMEESMAAPAEPESVQTLQQVVSAGMEQLGDGKNLLARLGRVLVQVPDFYAHALQTCLYGLALARGAGLSHRADLNDLGVGLLLHDVGKLELPIYLWHSARPLGEDDWRTVREHPVRGMTILGSSSLFGAITRDVVALHHERLDGSGYPFGKCAAELALPVQIAAIANAFDRRTTTSPYRESRHAVDMLRDMIVGGRYHFSPKLLATFVRLLAA
ncbi:MAG: HD domain-containing protein [Planctomycetes bacterium]|nr:HD domain-containing protein [Planctomycetota bacterium]